MSVLAGRSMFCVERRLLSIPHGLFSAEADCPTCGAKVGQLCAVPPSHPGTVPEIAPAPQEAKAEIVHDHKWVELVKRACGESVDAYSECACGAMLHVYTFDPYCIRHETVMLPGLGARWTHGYAMGMKTILDDKAR